MKFDSKVWAWIGFGAALVLTALFFFPAAPDSRPSQSLVRMTELKADQVRVESRLEKNKIEDDSADVLHVAVVNDSAIALTSLHLSVTSPLTSVGADTLRCEGAAALSAAKDVLNAQQRCEYTVLISTSLRSGVYGIAAVVTWKHAAAPGLAAATTLDRQVTSTLGPVMVDRSFGAASWTRLARRFAALLKDLTLPVILVGLGAWFSGEQNDRDSARKADEEAREADRVKKDGELQQARLAVERQLELDRMNAEREKEEARRDAEIKTIERQEVHRLLLGRVMELAEKHYLPFAANARLILIEAGKIESHAPDAALDKVFLNVLLLLKRMENFRLMQGGLFFSIRDGERAAGAAWFVLKFTIQSALGDEDLAAALQQVKVDWDYGTYRAAFDGLDNAWKKFEQWAAKPATSQAGSFWQLLGVVDAFQAVMLFESDRALSSYWYQEDSKMVFLQPEPTTFYELAAASAHVTQQTAELQRQLLSTYRRPVTTVSIM